MDTLQAPSPFLDETMKRKIGGRRREEEEESGHEPLYMFTREE